MLLMGVFRLHGSVLCLHMAASHYSAQSCSLLCWLDCWPVLGVNNFITCSSVHHGMNSNQLGKFMVDEMLLSPESSTSYGNRSH